MHDEPLTWKLLGFPEAIDSWVERESPKDDIRLVVLDWAMGRHDDPYRGMRREEGMPNLWFGPIPGAADRAGGSARTCNCHGSAGR